MTISKDVLDRLYAFTGPFEGSIPHMYLDTVGKVTVGIGFMLPDVAAAQRLPFSPADQIAADFQKVSAAPKGRVASFYKQFTRCTLPEDGLRAEFDRRVQVFALQLVNGYQLESYPLVVQVALLDMAYNLGAGALLSKWPSLKAACAKRDWATAAKQCRRNGIGDKRNLATAALFTAAIKS